MVRQLVNVQNLLSSSRRNNKPIIRTDKDCSFGFNSYPAPIAPDSRINYSYMNRSVRKILCRPIQQKRTHRDIEFFNLMTDIDDLNILADRKNYCFHLSNEWIR